MKYQEYNISSAAGVILGSSLSLGQKFYPKGHRLNAEDIIIFKMFDITAVFGAEYEDGDIEYQTALRQIAAALCGEGLGYRLEGEILQFVALQEGVLQLEAQRLAKFNSFNENIILNALAPFSVVKKGDIIAKLEILPPLLRQNEVDEILFKLSGNLALLSLGSNHTYSAAFVYAHLLNDEAERARLLSSTKRLISVLQDYHINYRREIDSASNSEALHNAFYQAFNSGVNLVFVVSALKDWGADGFMAQILRSLTDDIYNCTVPEIGNGELLIAEKSGRRIIVLPHNFDASSAVGAAELIKRAIFSEHLSPSSFLNKQSASLPPSQVLDITKTKLITPSAKSSAKAKVGVVVLAAGQGRRAGCAKLLVEGNDGLPLFMHAVNEAVASQARPVFVITGHRHEELEDWLQKLDVNVIYNPAYETGVRTSVRLGLKAMPASCNGAILLPADMPNITASELNKLIAKMDASSPKQLCYLTRKGVKYNPVLWSKSLYDKADLIPENSAFRVVFAEHADYSKSVEVKDKAILKDITFPNDVKEYSAE
ncbi:MAG: NTP transferase domain-containing protein [Alphaproteobacteria bacterium]|nr:NTP transferase domain-containing protein [Alphaproteobacteria bacterium]